MNRIRDRKYPFTALAFVLICSILFGMIAYKVFHIPITHDETATTVHYSNYTVWQIMMYPDNWPNNHILNTLCTKLFISLFGNEQWVVRLPNLLSFIIYCLGVYKILTTLFKNQDLSFLAGAVLFFANAYLLDFFGLSRGYGMSIALLTFGISFLLLGFIKYSDRHIWLSIIFATLASYANFTMLIFWIAILFTSIFYFLMAPNFSIRKRLIKGALIAFMSIGYVVLIYTPIKKMTSTDQFHYWNSTNFFDDTILSLITNWMYNLDLPFGAPELILGYLLIGVLFLGGIYFISRIVTSKSIQIIFHDPLIISLGLFSLVAGINIALHFFLGIPYLQGRTALLYYPLFSLLCVTLLSTIDTPAKRKMHHILSFAIMIIGIIYLTGTYNHKNVREWWYDENTLEVMEYLKNVQADQNKNITLDVNWHFHRSFFFYTYTGKASHIDLEEYNKDIDPESTAQFYYVLEEDLDLFDDNFEVVKKYGWDRYLLQHVIIEEND